MTWNLGCLQDVWFRHNDCLQMTLGEAGGLAVVGYSKSLATDASACVPQWMCHVVVVSALVPQCGILSRALLFGMPHGGALGAQ